MDRPEQGGPADTDADQPNPGSSDPASITEHLRRLWAAGARDITITSTDQVVRHRTYLTHPRTDTWSHNL